MIDGIGVSSYKAAAIATHRALLRHRRADFERVAAQSLSETILREAVLLLLAHDAAEAVINYAQQARMDYSDAIADIAMDAAEGLDHLQ